MLVSSSCQVAKDTYTGHSKKDAREKRRKKRKFVRESPLYCGHKKERRKKKAGRKREKNRDQIKN